MSLWISISETNSATWEYWSITDTSAAVLVVSFGRGVDITMSAASGAPSGAYR